MILADVISDAGRILPIGGLLGALIILFKVVWRVPSDARTIEGSIRKAWQDDRDALLTAWTAERKTREEEFDAQLHRLSTSYEESLLVITRTHEAEVKSMNLRLEVLERLIADLRGGK